MARALDEVIFITYFTLTHVVLRPKISGWGLRPNKVTRGFNRFRLTEKLQCQLHEVCFDAFTSMKD